MNTIQNAEGEHGHALGTFARFFRWLFSGRMMRRGLFVLACLATLTGLLFAVENWRGKRAWEQCRRELEAKGEVLDWNAYTPEPVPDEQNVYKAPRIAEWFVKGTSAAAASSAPSKSLNTNAPFRLSPRQDTKDPVLVAEVDVVPPNGPPPPGKADAVLRFDDPAASEQAAKLLDGIIGPSIEGARAELIVARPRDQIKPLHLVVQADTLPTAKALAEFLTHSPGPYQVRAVLRRDAWGRAGWQQRLSRVAEAFGLCRGRIPRPEPAGGARLRRAAQSARTPLHSDGHRLPAAL